MVIRAQTKDELIVLDNMAKVYCAHYEVIPEDDEKNCLYDIWRIEAVPSNSDLDAIILGAYYADWEAEEAMNGLFRSLHDDASDYEMPAQSWQPCDLTSCSDEPSYLKPCLDWEEFAYGYQNWKTLQIKH